MTAVDREGITAWWCTEDSVGQPVRAAWRWTSDDPMAVRLEVTDPAGDRVVFELWRRALAVGSRASWALDGAAVGVFAELAEGLVAVTSTALDVTVRVESCVVTEFLRATWAVCPESRETAVTMAALDRWLAGVS